MVTRPQPIEKSSCPPGIETSSQVFPQRTTFWGELGLSKNQPFCDGTHNKTARTEDAGKLYWYDAQGNRQECADQYPGISTA